ncbi:MAG: flippase-like domain-containing protein [Methanosarcinaceae archaeon]|nr:flippase-like domain-containing protein [Methanosarcinaceae archaeon]MDD4331807.1 flippase-like domain-containing protein [Methanosarcinaceae archaeon]
MNNSVKWILSSILISIFSIAALFFFTRDSIPADFVKVLRPEYILAAFCIHMFSFIIWGLRTKSMAEALGHKIAFFTSIEIVISSTFVAAITPSSIGGEPLRIHLLNQNQVPVGKATAVVFGERLLDALFILLAAPFSLHLFRDLLADSRLDALLASGEILLILSLSLLFYVNLKPRRLKALIPRLAAGASRVLGRKIGLKVSKLSSALELGFEEFRSSLGILFREGRKGLFFGFIYTVLFWLVEFSMLFVILLGLRQTPALSLVFAAQVLLMMIIVLPLTPGSSGVAEVAASSLFSIFVPASLLGITVAAWRAFTFYLNLLAGGLVSFKLLKNSKLLQKYIK